MARRRPTHDERAVLDALFAHDFDGAEPLRKQWAVALVESSCDCGCGSIRFEFADRTDLRPSSAVSPLPVDGEILDSEGRVIGGLLVLLRGGWLDDVDVHSYTHEPLPFPSADMLRWRA